MEAAPRGRPSPSPRAARVDGFEDGRREGYEAGFSKGYAAGIEQALAEHQEKLLAATEALLAAQAQFDQVTAELQSQVLPDCVELALCVARRITKRQAQIDPQVLAANLEQAIKMVIGCTRLRITFHPDDRGTIMQVLERLSFSFPAAQSAEIVEDQSVARGGCRLQTEHGSVDADINAQLDRLVEQLLPATGCPASRPIATQTPDQIA
jgi:flagellar assembly protein FliH